MKYIVKQTFPTCLGLSYKKFNDMFKDLIAKMRIEIGHPFLLEGRWHNLRFVMSIRLYNDFLNSRKALDIIPSNMYKGIKIIIDPSLDAFPFEIVRLIYEDDKPEPCDRYCAHDVKSTYEFWTNQSKIKNALKEAINSKYGVTSAKPHIDHVIFNGPATIVFWKDGTKTVVKHDGKGRKDKRQAVLYAFVRKIYGEGKSYHNILNEIEEAIK